MANQFSKETNKPTPDSPETTAIKQLADAIMARAPRNPMELGLPEDAVRRLQGTPEPKRFRVIKGRSEDTGATFDMNVVESKSMPNGRITALNNYKHPEGMFTFEQAGGKVPDGFPILADTSKGWPSDQEIPRHMLSNKYLQWRWTMFWQNDLRRLIGKQVVSHYCLDPETGLKTPWIEGRVGLEVEAAE